jgi:membrane AbrB-like protein
MDFENSSAPKSFESVLSALGANPVPFAKRLNCCGFHAVYPAEADAHKMCAELVDCAAKAEAHCVVTPCPLCQMQLDMYQNAACKAAGVTARVPALHLQQLVGLALGVPAGALGFERNIVEPAALKSIGLVSSISLMNGLPLLFVVGFGGALLFKLLKLPGGAMAGAMICVVAFTMISGHSSDKAPEWLTFIVYTCVGVMIGSMYKPGMLQAIGATWPTLVLSTALILLAGCLCAWMVARSGVLSIAGAYLATSPGGFNAIMGYALDNEEAPIVMVYHLVRIYAVVLLAPYIGRLLGLLLK